MPIESARKNGRRVLKDKNTVSTRPVPNQVQTKIEELDQVPLELQQQILNVYKTAFPVSEVSKILQETIQKVKGHLFNRDFDSAFGEQGNLEAYAVRWSAARSLAYTSIFARRSRELGLHDVLNIVGDDVQQVSEIRHEVNETDTTSTLSALRRRAETRVVCIGGGAGAEMISLAATYSQSERQSRMVITAVDVADWSIPVSKLAAAVYEGPKLSVHASEAVKARPENRALLEQPDSVEVLFQQQDVLTWDKLAMSETIKNANLCTIMFTLNELFSASLKKTTSFLLNLTNMMVSDSHLLIVDSPGSYSEIQMQSTKTEQDRKGNETASTKKYPMKWLLDHTLLTMAKHVDEAVWEKVEENDSLWFRMDAKNREKLQYPIELENMRYQLHLYRRI